MPVKVPFVTLSIKLHFYHGNQLFYTFSVHTSFQSTLNVTNIFIFLIFYLYIFLIETIYMQ